MCPNATRILSYYEFDYEGGLATPLQKVKITTYTLPRLPLSPVMHVCVCMCVLQRR